MLSGSFYLLSENLNILVRSFPNIDQCSVMLDMIEFERTLASALMLHPQ